MFVVTPVGLSSDEGITVHHAARIFEGEVMYLDFFEFNGPMDAYAMALAFRLLGPSLLTVGLVGVLLASATATFSLLLASHLMPRTLAVLSTAFVVVSVFPGYAVADWHRWSVFYALPAVCGLLSTIGQPQLVRFLGVGLLLGLQSMSVQSSAALMTLTALGFCWLRPGTLRERCARLASLLFGLLLSVGTVVLWFGRQGALDAMIYDRVVWVSTNYVPLGIEHFGSLLFWAVMTLVARDFEVRGEALLNLLFCLTTVWFALAAVMECGVRALFGLARTRTLSAEWFVALATGAMLVSMFTAFDHSHVMHVAPFWIPLVVSWAVHPRLATGASPNRRARFLLGWLVVVFVAYAGYRFMGLAQSRYRLDFPRGSLRTGDRYQAMQAQRLREFVERRTRRGDPIIVYPYAPYYYFLLDRKCPIRYSTLAPGYYTEAQIREALRDLERVAPRVFLHDTSTYAMIRDRWPTAGTDTDPVLRYLKRHYRSVGAFAGLELWERDRSGK